MKKFMAMGIVVGIVITMLFGMAAHKAGEIYNEIESKRIVSVRTQADLGTGDYLTVIDTKNGFGEIIDTKTVYTDDYLIG